MFFPSFSDQHASADQCQGSNVHVAEERTNIIETHNHQKNYKTKKSQTKSQNRAYNQSVSVEKTIYEKSKVNKELSIFSANADGLYGKTSNLKYQIKESNAHIFTVQETKYRKKGKFSMEEFDIFESIRKNKEKGGTMLGIHK